MRKKDPAFRLLLGVLLVFTQVTLSLAADLEEIKGRGVLRHLGVPYANFVSGSGDGLDVELCQLFARRLGVRYEYIKTDWGTVVQDLIGRKIRVNGAEVEFLGPEPARGEMIANGFTVLPWREKVVKFSAPTFPSQIWLVARADSTARPITPTGEIGRDIELTRALMKGKKVLAVEKTCLDPKLYDLAAAGAQVACFKGQLNELAPAILNNEAEMTVLDVPDALIAVEKWPGKLKILGPISPKQVMAAAFAPDTPRLLAEYNAFLAEIKKDGTYLRLVNRYYPSARIYFPEFFQGL